MSKRVKVISGIAALSIVIVMLILFFSFFIEKKEETEHRDWGKIKESGRLRVATEKSTLGFRFVDNKVEGFNYEIVKAFADSMKLELEIILVNDLDSAILGLWEHKYDIIALNIPNTTEINKNISLTVPIISSRQMLIQHLSKSDTLQKELLTEHRQLKDIEIVIPKNSPFKMRLENLSDEIAEPLKIKELQGVTTEELVETVSLGKVQYTICDELQARKLNRQFPDFDYSMPIGFNQQYAWGVSKKSMGLYDELNKFLKDFLTTNTYWNIYRKYY